MFSNRVQAIVLAAGKSTRFNTGRTKLLEKICGQEMILYTTRVLEQLSVPITVVVGYQKDAIQQTISQRHHNTNSIKFVVQEEQCGTGHALMCTKLVWERDHILILNGDVPLVTTDIIHGLFETHTTKNADISFVIAHNADPACGSYGRVVKNDGSIKIVEARDFDGDANEHCCINAGIYLIRKQFLQECIDSVSMHATAKEFFITDLVKIASEKSKTIAMFSAPFDRVRGINTLQELWVAEQIKRAELIKYWMDRGVHFSVAQNVHLDIDVIIGSGTYIGCGAHILTGTAIGKNCKIHEFASLENSRLGDDCEILPHSIVKDSTIGSNSSIGPFAHVKENSLIGQNVTLGNFVEVKKSTIGDGTKAKHLAYLGDARIGANVNIGAGTITCNYSGSGKHQTVIHDNAFIGSNNTLIAPVTIEQNAYTAAGSVISENVPANALAIARARQVNKEGYANQLRDIKTPEAARHANSTLHSFMGALKSKPSETSEPT
jgi:bifunctional UDP-N-acetylglucosamine pyrophosphorylase/glucosamine-1-phosphate N-acetyltransferase